MSLKKAKIKSKALFSRIGGVSAFGFGVSLKLPEADRTVVRELLIFLEDRRALYVGSIWEQPEHVAASILQMRSELTNAIKRLSEKSLAQQCCRLMRASCRDFLEKNNAEKVFSNPNGRCHSTWEEESFLISLGALRAIFGHQIAVLAHAYEVDVEQHLAAILPPAP